MTDDEIRKATEAIAYASNEITAEMVALRQDLCDGLAVLVQAIEKAVEDLNNRPLKIQIEELRDPRRLTITPRISRHGANPGQSEMFHGEHSSDLPDSVGYAEASRLDGAGLMTALVVDETAERTLPGRRRKVVRKRPGDPIRHGIRWTEEEVRRIIILAHEGKSVGQIARLHQRKESGIKSEFKRHGYQIRGGYVLGVRKDDPIREGLKK